MLFTIVIHAFGNLSETKIEMIMEQKTQYTCPMHPEVIKDEPGKCPKCGMNLVPTKKEKSNYTGHYALLLKHASEPAAPRGVGTQYFCPMLCEGDKKYPAPGKCPVCGMNLIATSAVSSRAR